MAVVDLLKPLVAAQFHLFGVDHDDEVAIIDVRGPGGLELTGEGTGNTYGERSATNSRGVDDVPIVLGLCRLLLVGALHIQNPKKSRAGARGPGNPRIIRVWGARRQGKSGANAASTRGFCRFRAARFGSRATGEGSQALAPTTEHDVRRGP